MDTAEDLTKVMQLFENHVVGKKRKRCYEIKCRLNLWGVVGPDEQSAEQEALRYFIQYYNSGEYAQK